MSAMRYEIDTKAMRKLHGNQVVFGAVAFAAEVGSANVSFVMGSRMLSKLG